MRIGNERVSPMGAAKTRDRACRVFAGIALLCASVLAQPLMAAAQEKTAVKGKVTASAVVTDQVASAAKVTANDSSKPPYFMTTAQLPNPLRPFEHLPDNARINVRAAVMTIADPLETRLGRTFDVELGAVMSAFQASGYVLDGFAFTWQPGKSTKDDEYAEPSAHTRDTPSVLLLRHDDWRECAKKDHYQGCGSSYFALFLVGETPSSGVHPKAFLRAVKCAVAIDSSNRNGSSTFQTDLNKADCDVLAEDPTLASIDFRCEQSLNVIGPVFSGSMESLAASLSKAAIAAKGVSCSGMKGSKTRHLKIGVLSPSASIEDNDEVRYHAYLRSADDDRFNVSLDYGSLALSVSCQMAQVEAYLADRIDMDDSGDAKGRVVVLSEESSFGQGAAMYVQKQDQRAPSACKIWGKDGAMVTPPDPHLRLTNVQFPPNIAAIRAEHVKAQQQETAERRQLFPERLLELDLTGVDKGVDRPPAYQPSLSSRSDELMLYQTFDALTRYVRPSAVIIVATDVRDRIFLVSQIRDALPGALPVVLEQDNLMVHPDYRKISRGAITMPAGRSLVCLDDDGGPMSCPAGKPSGSPQQDCPVSSNRRGPAHYFAFATDYAANAFRAIVTLVKWPDDPIKHASTWLDRPYPLVATLAGYQSALDPVGLSFDRSRSKDLLVAAAPRIQLQQPIYLAMGVGFLLMLVGAAWIIWNRRDLALATVATCRHAFRRTTIRRRCPPLVRGAAYAWLWLWTVVAALGIALAVYRVWLMFPPPHKGDTDLAHGRDLWALLELSFVYVCFIALAALRLLQWNAHCSCLARAVGTKTRFGERIGQHGYRIAIGGAAILMLCLWASVNDRTPTRADSIFASVVSAAFAVSGSAIFLLLAIEGYDRWRRITLELRKVVELIPLNTGIKTWPNFQNLDEQPCSPFNLVLRIRNYESWRNLNPSRWAQQTSKLIDDKLSKRLRWCFPRGESRQFLLWQAQLVAEMKLASVAVRTCAWSAFLGAALALTMMQVYPPVYPRVQATAGIALLLLSAAGVIYAVLQLEKDRLLGPMFTNNEDKLTFGGALSLLWPKLLAVGSVLVMLLLPGAWTWLGGLIKAVNSLH